MAIIEGETVLPMIPLKSEAAATPIGNLDTTTDGISTNTDGISTPTDAMSLTRIRAVRPRRTENTWYADLRGCFQMLVSYAKSNKLTYSTKEH